MISITPLNKATYVTKRIMQLCRLCNLTTKEGLWQ
jgi:hypothetical protein